MWNRSLRIGLLAMIVVLSATFLAVNFLGHLKFGKNKHKQAPSQLAVERTPGKPFDMRKVETVRGNGGEPDKDRPTAENVRKQRDEVGAEDRDGQPLRLSQHLGKLAKTIPANGGLHEPGGASDEAFAQRAYPDTDIPVERLTTARSHAKAAMARNFDEGRRGVGTWTNVGPSDAIYPLTPLRTSSLYVPNQYAAGGRTTALALSRRCDEDQCTLWASPAGGGVWRTRNALSRHPRWTYLAAPFEINAVGSLALDPNDPSGETIWVGTGEANACGSGCEAGVGLYKSTDGGDTWTGPIGQSVFNARAIGSIAIKSGDSNTLFAGTTRGLRGASSVCCDGAVTLIPGAPKWGLYRSTDGGNTWTYVHNGSTDPTTCTGDVVEASDLTPCSPRGVRRVVFDPSDANTLYASSYARGVWRSSDGGTTWMQINPSLASTTTTMRPEIAVNKLPNGKTRMYVAEGASGAPTARLSRSDDVTTATPAFTVLTSSDPANPGYGSFNYCGGQCWYDNFVTTPAGHPDMVYLGGSYQYGETGGISNGRGVVLSTDAGVSFTDMTMDATDPVHPNGLHPDQHFLVTNPRNPFQFWESSDGGVMRSSGSFADISANCAPRRLTGSALTRCQQLLSRVPTRLTSLNNGLTTLQFQSLSVNPFNVLDLQGGTQDNGTWEASPNLAVWFQTIFGDGGQSGFDIVDPQFRFHNYTGTSPDVNFTSGLMADWNWIGDPFFLLPSGPEPSQFYVPMISDPVVSGTMYAGAGHVWRTKTHGLGTMTVAELRLHCNEFTGDFAVTCGDWQPLGTADQLIGTAYGTDRTGGNGLAAVQRGTGDTSTLWAASARGRVFVSKNVDAEPAASVVFTRIDPLDAASPNRFVSGIYVDPKKANHAWISYSGFSASTPATPGHVFDVRYDPVAATAKWTDISYDLGDLPITGVVRDDVTGALYASSDFGVFRLGKGRKSWTLAAPGMPNVEVAGLTIATKARKLYAASHGLGAWVLNLGGD
jgi:hypothetical protein